MARLDSPPVPRALALTRDDLELALAVGDRAALVVLAPRAGLPDLGVGVVAGSQHVAVGGAHAAGGEHARLDRECGEPGGAQLGRQPAAAGEARGGRVQAAALGDDDGHDEPPHRRADRERMAEALDAVVAADDQARAERAGALELGRDARLQVDVALARPPGAQRRLERARRRRRAPRGARARRAGAPGAGRRARRRRRCRSAAWPSLASAAAGWPANSRAAATNPASPANHSTVSSARPRPRRSCSASMRGRSTFVVRARASSGVTTTHIALAVEPASMRFSSPAVSQATAPDVVRTIAGAPRSASSARTCASFAATSAAAELSAVPNGEAMMANAFTSVDHCQLGIVRQSRTLFARLAGYCDDAG